MALLTYDIAGAESQILESGKRLVKTKLTIGDSAAAYTAGGIALEKKKLGMKEVVDSLLVTSKDGYIYKVDLTGSEPKILIFEQDAGGDLAEITGNPVARDVYLDVRGH